MHRIKELRKALNIKQVDFAERILTTHGRKWGIMTGLGQPPKQMRVRRVSLQNLTAYALNAAYKKAFRDATGNML